MISIALDAIRWAQKKNQITSGITTECGPVQITVYPESENTQQLNRILNKINRVQLNGTSKSHQYFCPPVRKRKQNNCIKLSKRAFNDEQHLRLITLMLSCCWAKSHTENKQCFLVFIKALQKRGHSSPVVTRGTAAKNPWDMGPSRHLFFHGFIHAHSDWLMYSE